MAVTDWIFVPELTASPWPAAVGWQSVPGRKSNQLLHGHDFLFYYWPKMWKSLRWEVCLIYNKQQRFGVHSLQNAEQPRYRCLIYGNLETVKGDKLISSVISSRLYFILASLRKYIPVFLSRIVLQSCLIESLSWIKLIHLLRTN